MSASVTPEAERIKLPANFNLFRHQREAIEAWQQGHTRQIWRWHRGAGKGVASVALLALAAWERPAQHVHVSPSFRKSRENIWDAICSYSGHAYLSAIPEQLVVDRNENELSITMRTKYPGKHSRVMFLSADAPDRLRGIHPATAILDEYSSWESGDEGLRVLRPAIERARGTLVVTSTPKGSTNHFANLWRSVEDDPAWWCSLRTIEDTAAHDGQPLIPTSVVAQELKEGVERAWCDQEYYCSLVAANLGAYFGEALDRMEQEQRIGDFPWMPELPVVVALDLGVHDETFATIYQPFGAWTDLIDEMSFSGLSLGEILSRIRARPWNIESWCGPHDLSVRDLSAIGGVSGEAVSRLVIAQRLGVNFLVAPRLTHPEYHDAIRRLMASRLRINRKTCPRILDALANYGRDWDGKLKVYRDRPRHDQHSHPIDSLKTFATGYQPKKPKPPGWKPTPSKTQFNPLSYADPMRRPAA